MSVAAKQAPSSIIPKKNRIREGNKFATAVIYFIAAIIAFITIYPMYYVLILSLSDPLVAMSQQVYWVPIGLNFDSYRLLVDNPTMWRAYLNTILYVIPTTLLMLTTCMMAGYPLTVKGLWGRKWINIFLLIPMYFGGGTIPTFLLMTKIGLYDTPLALIIPACYSIWNIILTKAYLSSIPESLREAARIDGANVYQTLFRVYLPMAKPILAVIAVYTIVGVWNSWYSASIYLPHTEWQPLQLYLRRVLVENSEDLVSTSPAVAAEVYQLKLTNAQLKYAMIIFTTLPILCIYPFLQKYFVKGMMLGSLKE